MNEPSEYDHGFLDGLITAVTLGRAGASPDQIAAVLPSDPGERDPAGYQTQLAELRRILRTDWNNVIEEPKRE